MKTSDHRHPYQGEGGVGEVWGLEASLTSNISLLLRRNSALFLDIGAFASGLVICFVFFSPRDL